MTDYRSYHLPHAQENLPTQERLFWQLWSLPCQRNRRIRMRKSLHRLTTLLIFMILCLTIGSPAVLAAESPSLELGVTENLSGTLPAVPEDFLIKLAAVEIGNPMPEATLN